MVIDLWIAFLRIIALHDPSIVDGMMQFMQLYTEYASQIISAWFAF